FFAAMLLWTLPSGGVRFFWEPHFLTTIHPLFYDSLKLLLTPRERDSHKGDYGHVLVVGGDHGMGGAVLLAGEAAARSGAGLAAVAAGAGRGPALIAHRPELVARGRESSVDLPALVERATVLVLGPGLGQSAWSRECLQQALVTAAERSLMVVLDA